MRVLHVISDENIGGAGVLLCTLLRNFDPERVQSVVALPKGSLLLRRIRELEIPVRQLKHPSDRLSLSSVGEVGRILREEGIDLVHANAAISARLAGRMYGVPVLHTRHCCFPPSGALRFPPLRHAAGMLNRSLSDHVIATADAAAENLISLGVPKEKISVIINGSDPVRTVSAEELCRLRRELDLDKEDFTVGICARLEPCKGHSVFLEGAKIALRRLPQAKFRFLIAGSGSLEGFLKEEAQRLGIAHAVRFLGFVSDMAPLWHILRVNVNCSVGTETSCLALSEGMSASVPCVVSDYGGNRAMVGESHAGFVIPQDDPERLADALCRLATDRELEERMRRAAYRRYTESYTAVRMSEHLTAVYEALYQHDAVFGG